ncbi:putative transcription factor WD40-like family [Helianthus annuus]|nr:putative transcription factor WD40-like family [Helianthus annuus]
MELALDKIMSIRQEGTVRDYCDSFLLLFDQVRNSEEMSDFYAIYLFICGLEPRIRNIFVEWHQYSCTKVKDVISLALKIDSNGLQDSFSPFDPNSSFYNKDLEFDINITLEELMKDNEFFKNGKIQEADIVQEMIDDEVIDESTVFVHKSTKDKEICDESIVFVQELGDNEFLGTDFSKNLHGSESFKQDVGVEFERVNVDNSTTVPVILYDQENIGLKARFDMVQKSLENILVDPLVVLNREGVVVEKIQVRKKWYVKLHSGDILRYGFSSRLYRFQEETENALKVLAKMWKKLRSEKHKFELARVKTFEWKPGWQYVLKMSFLFQESWFLSFNWVFHTYTAYLSPNGNCFITFEGCRTCIFIVQVRSHGAQFVCVSSGADSLLKLWSIKTAEGSLVKLWSIKAYWNWSSVISLLLQLLSVLVLQLWIREAIKMIFFMQQCQMLLKLEQNIGEDMTDYLDNSYCITFGGYCCGLHCWNKAHAFVFDTCD